MIFKRTLTFLFYISLLLFRLVRVTYLYYLLGPDKSLPYLIPIFKYTFYLF